MMSPVHSTGDGVIMVRIAIRVGFEQNGTTFDVFCTREQHGRCAGRNTLYAEKRGTFALDSL